MRIRPIRAESRAHPLPCWIESTFAGEPSGNGRFYPPATPPAPSSLVQRADLHSTEDRLASVARAGSEHYRPALLVLRVQVVALTAELEAAKTKETYELA